MNLSGFSFQALPLVSASELQYIILSEKFILSNEVAFQFSCSKLIRQLFNSCCKAFFSSPLLSLYYMNHFGCIFIKILKDTCTYSVNILLPSVIQHTKINTVAVFLLIYRRIVLCFFISVSSP